LPPSIERGHPAGDLSYRVANVALLVGLHPLRIIPWHHLLWGLEKRMRAVNCGSGG